MHLLHFFFLRGRSKIACLYHGVNLQKETEYMKIRKKTKNPQAGAKAGFQQKERKEASSAFLGIRYQRLPSPRLRKARRSLSKNTRLSSLTDRSEQKKLIRNSCQATLSVSRSGFKI